MKMSLKFKTLLLIVFLTVLPAGAAVILSYKIHVSTVNSYYIEQVSNIGKSEVSMIDPEAVSEFLELVTSGEFQDIHNKAVTAEDEGMVEDYLKQAGVYDTYLDITSRLDKFCSNMNVEDIYLESVQGTYSINLFDPYESILDLGTVMETPEEFTEYTTNDAIPATISHTEYGWLCSGYESVIDANGNKIALVGVDINMNDVVADRQRYLRNLIICMALFVLGGAAISVLLMNKAVIKSLDMLAEAATDFVSSNEYSMGSITELPLHTGDEVETLYNAVKKMETDIIEYINNLTAVTVEKERIGAELSVAAQIQSDMLPSIFPAFPERDEFDIFALMSPAKEVGGDFYDFFLVDNNRLAMVMADVSGKGVPAALFMVIAKTLIKNRAQMGDSPAQILKNVNEQLCEGNKAELFVTVWLAVIDISTGKGTAANAGHEHPTLRHSDGKYELITYRHSPAVATMESIRFKEHEFELKPGDSIFVYTDGVPEATNADNELYGTDRMLEALNSEPDARPEKLLENVKRSVNEFVGNAPQFDDLTMLGFTYLRNGGV